ASALLPQPNPLRQGLRLTLGGLEHDIAHRFHVGYGDLAATQSSDKANHRRSGAAARVHGGTYFRRHHATQVRRTEREVAIDDADSLEPLQALRNLRTGKRPEPAQPYEANFLSFIAQLANRHFHRR